MVTHNKIRVLVAEDDPVSKLNIVTQLEQKGYDVVAVTVNGQEAVDATCEQTPDVVVMDVQMPLMDGLTATRIIQEECPTPVIILSSFDTEDFVRKASEVGASAYLIKPLKGDEVDRAIALALARHNDIMKIRSLYEQVASQKKELEKALSEIKTLQGIIPICSYCKKIRNDEGYWEQVEKYITDHSQAEFSHGVCKECYHKLMDEL